MSNLSCYFVTMFPIVSYISGISTHNIKTTNIEKQTLHLADSAKPVEATLVQADQTIPEEACKHKTHSPFLHINNKIDQSHFTNIKPNYIQKKLGLNRFYHQGLHL